MHMSSHSATAPKRCLCHFVQDDTRSSLPSESSSNLQCPSCVQRSLKPHIERHDQAMIDHGVAREQCARQMTPNRLSEWQSESQRLRDRLATLRKECGGIAVRVASQAVENDSHRESMDPATDLHRHHMDRLEASLLQGAMSHAIQVGTEQVRILRFQWARKTLRMHRVDVDPQDAKMMPLRQEQQRRARGIGKIAGLPLPHAGPELYGVLPPRELQSALRLVASVTLTVARCLGIVLPHPILLTPNGPMGDITETVSDHTLQDRDEKKEQLEQQQQQQQQQQNGQPVGSSSTSSLLSLMDGSWKTTAKNALKRATGHQRIEQSVKSIVIPPSMDASLVAQRLHHATAAVLAEDSSSSSSKFSLGADVMHQEAFATALQLLQNNVIVLCIRAGVPVNKLWPGEALLLNLHALDVFCEDQTAVSY
jgi:hypothetical protein